MRTEPPQSRKNKQKKNKKVQRTCIFPSLIVQGGFVADTGLVIERKKKFLAVFHAVSLRLRSSHWVADSVTLCLLQAECGLWVMELHGW
jgi:hypothetical protein